MNWRTEVENNENEIVQGIYFESKNNTLFIKGFLYKDKLGLFVYKAKKKYYIKAYILESDLIQDYYKDRKYI